VGTSFRRGGRRITPHSIFFLILTFPRYWSVRARHYWTKSNIILGVIIILFNLIKFIFLIKTLNIVHS
jgi:hypothetical protein